ncbi:MAG: ABC transporter permease [Defluviitaleaceae bacterium]|nr:ABC transporter permease [Defluviitaleaceae bacterium]
MLIIQGAVSLGLIFSLMAVGVYLTFRVLKMPDLSVEGSIILGAGMSARLISDSYIAIGNPFLVTLIAMLAGMLAGFTTGILHTKLKIPSILAGILTMVASYSIVIRIMGASNIALPPHGPWRVTTVFTFLQDAGLSRSLAVIVVSFVIVVVSCVLLYCFMGTEFGSAVRATGNNPQMVKAQGINTDWTVIVCLMLSNGLVALAGSLWAQQQGFASVDMGVGTIVVGLASVIIAEVIFRPRMFWTHLIAIVIGSIIYRFIIVLALDLPQRFGVDLLRPTDLRLVTAIIVTLALVQPLLRDKLKKLFRRKESPQC